MRYLGVLGILLGLGCGGGTGILTTPGDQTGTIEDLIGQGWQLYEQGQYDGAIVKFEGVLQLESNRSSAHNGLGWSYFRKQDLKKARETFEKAIRFAPSSADAFVGLAGVALSEGDAGKNREKYSEVIVNANQALLLEAAYTSNHDRLTWHHVRLILAQAYFYLGKYTKEQSPDPNNAEAQIRKIDVSFAYTTPANLLKKIEDLVRG